MGYVTEISTGNFPSGSLRQRKSNQTRTAWNLQDFNDTKSEAMKYNHKVNNFQSPMMKLLENNQSIRHSSMLFKT